MDICGRPGSIFKTFLGDALHTVSDILRDCYPISLVAGNPRAQHQIIVLQGS